MLTEKQLQALVGCGEKEDCTGETCPMFETCDNDYTNKVAAEAAKTALELADMLKQLEWVYNGGAQECPWCQNSKGAGHSDDCELAALLKKVRNEG
jgi:hypothetical protein